MVGAPLGSKNGAKLTNDTIKAEAYKQYCAHLAKGKKKRTWRFKHPDVSLTWETMEKYIKEALLHSIPYTKKSPTSTVMPSGKRSATAQRSAQTAKPILPRSKW